MTPHTNDGVVRFSDADLTTERLLLRRLTPEDAEVMAEVLADAALHEFIGGQPATLEELRDRYDRLVEGPRNPGEVWLNWIARQHSDDQAIGTVQATVDLTDSRWTAQVAWVIGVEWQRRGYATEAARTVVEWLQQRGVTRIVANIHPDHSASELVARRAGLRPTRSEADGERVWQADTRPQ